MPSAEPPARRGAVLERVEVQGHASLPLDAGWQAAPSAPDEHTDPGPAAALAWSPASVPGTAAGAMRDAGLWRPGETYDFDGEDWWFRTSFQAARAEAAEEVLLELGGIATLADVFLNGQRILSSESMFSSHVLDVGALLDGENELAIRCRALAPLLEISRRPRARWRTRLVAGGLRFHRTMLLGRAPGFAPGPAAVGPWRPISLRRCRAVAVDAFSLRTSLTGGGSGRAAVIASLRPLDGRRIERVELELSRSDVVHRCELSLAAVAGTGAGAVEVEGGVELDGVERWWPHTHGSPALYAVRLVVSTSDGPVTVEAGRTGFRSLAAGPAAGHDVEQEGIDLHVNGLPVFARGAVWTPVDPVGLAPSPHALRRSLELLRDAGMNMLRVPGTAAYESADFHDACDELGLLVWQDFMFANLDYPVSDPAFRALVETEAAEVAQRLAGRPSLAVACGNSEVEQQVAMLGLDPTLGRGELFGEILPRTLEQAGSDVIYVPSAPCGGELPFRPGRGVANYYGVGGYRRPLDDARRADVRFAAECLAFSNVPDEAAVAAVAAGPVDEVVVHDPRWKAGVPRDVGAGWDFEDVRDHYLELLFGCEAGELRRVEHERYLELGRAVTGEVMAEVFGEWRRRASRCSGALVLWSSDLQPGAGWGLLDHSGRPKPAYYHLRRALAPVTVWTVDEGLAGIHVHLANDRSDPLAARLRVSLYRDGGERVAEGDEEVLLAAHGGAERDVEGILGRFVDASWAYRFGPPGHDVVVASLHPADGGSEPLAQAFRFPAGRPLARRRREELGLAGSLAADGAGRWRLTLRAGRLAYGVRIHVPGMLAADDAITLEPDVERTVALAPWSDAAPSSGGWLTALNMHGRAPIESHEPVAPPARPQAEAPEPTGAGPAT